MANDKEASDAMLGKINSRAMEVVELPKSEREARYKLYRQL
jgi:hypothetical protein